MTGPDLVPVEPSAVEAVGYDAEGHELWIRYTGGHVYVYVYAEVPEAVYRKLLDADSKGTFVNREIKPTYGFRRV